PGPYGSHAQNTVRRLAARNAARLDIGVGHAPPAPQLCGGWHRSRHRVQYCVLRVDFLPYSPGGNPGSRKSEPLFFSLASAPSVTQSLPRPLLLPEPPHQADGRCVLLAAASGESVGLKKRLVREITAPFIAHPKSVRDLVIERSRRLLQSLVHAAEQTARIGQIFHSTGECDTRRKLITRIRGATRDFTRRR